MELEGADEEELQLRSMLEQYEDCAAEPLSELEVPSLPSRSPSRPRKDGQEGHPPEELGRFLAFAHNRLLIRGRALKSVPSPATEKYVLAPSTSALPQLSAGSLRLVGIAVLVQSPVEPELEEDTESGLPMFDGDDCDETLAFDQGSDPPSTFHSHLDLHEPPLEPLALEQYERAHAIFDEYWEHVVQAIPEHTAHAHTAHAEELQPP